MRRWAPARVLFSTQQRHPAWFRALEITALFAPPPLILIYFICKARWRHWRNARQALRPQLTATAANLAVTGSISGPASSAPRDISLHAPVFSSTVPATVKVESQPSLSSDTPTVELK